MLVEFLFLLLFCLFTRLLFYKRTQSSDLALSKLFEFEVTRKPTPEKQVVVLKSLSRGVHDLGRLVQIHLQKSSFLVKSALPIQSAPLSHQQKGFLNGLFSVPFVPPFIYFLNNGIRQNLIRQNSLNLYGYQILKDKKENTFLNEGIAINKWLFVIDFNIMGNHMVKVEDHVILFGCFETFENGSQGTEIDFG